MLLAAITTCLSHFYLVCRYLDDIQIVTDEIILPSGVSSTIFLWMLDVDKSRKECEEFIVAESSRNAFILSA